MINVMVRLELKKPSLEAVPDHMKAIVARASSVLDRPC